MEVGTYELKAEENSQQKYKTKQMSYNRGFPYNMQMCCFRAKKCKQLLCK